MIIRDVSVLLIHGFTSNPESMRPWAEHLERAGYETSLPTLAGHGTRWQDLAGTSWQDWFASVLAAYDALHVRTLASGGSGVVVMGLSMGGTLALRLGELRSPAALVVTNPGLAIPSPAARYAGLLKHVLPSVKAIAGDILKPGAHEDAYPRVSVAAIEQLGRLFRDTRSMLAAIDAPLLIFRSTVDNVVSDASLETLLGGLSTAQRCQTQLEWLRDSAHVATVDNDAAAMFSRSASFIERYCAPETPERAPHGSRR